MLTPTIYRERRVGNHALAAVIVTALAVRLLLWAVYDGPARYPDSGTYLGFAEQIRSLDFSRYTGWRTPVYPLFLLVLGSNDSLVWLAQSALGVATTVLLYLLVARCTGSRAAGAAAALSHTLALNQLFYEAAILAETLATFLLVLTLYVAQRTSAAGWSLRRSSVVGALGASLALTRPLYIVVAPIVAMIIVLSKKTGGLRPAATLLCVFTAGVLAWCGFNKATLNYFGVTALAGYSLTNHAGAFMEKAPDEFATIRDIYVKYRDERIKAGKSHRMAIFDARDELMSKTGLSDAELSRQLTRLSLGLFVTHPADYLKSVAAAWVSFWAVPNPVREEQYRSPLVARVFEVISQVEKWGLRAGYVAFLLLAVPGLWIAWRRNGGADPRWNCAATLVTTVLAASVLQALLEYGENPRYGVPTQSIAMAAVVVVGSLFLQRKSVRAQNSPAAA